MYFELLNIFNMDKNGLYIWSAYTVVTITLIVFYIISNRKK